MLVMDLDAEYTDQPTTDPLREEKIAEYENITELIGYFRVMV